MPMIPLFSSEQISVADAIAIEIQEDVPQKRIITPDEFRAGAVVLGDSTVVRYLTEHSEDVRHLDRWEFQVFMANLIEKRGHRVRLGPKGRDGGVDIFAERETEYGPELVLVGCRHPNEGTKVGEPEVKLLYVEVLVRNATRGLFVTSASFTSTALDYIEEVKYRLDGADGDRIRKWLEALRTGAPGTEGRP